MKKSRRKKAEPAAPHFPDRDQIFDDGHRTHPSDAVQEFLRAWSGDAEERAGGDRDPNVDAVDDLARVGRITGAKPGESGVDEMRSHLGKVILHDEEIPDAEKDVTERFSPEDIRRIAVALNIPGRGTMGRHQLIQAIRSAMAGSGTPGSPHA